jgi:hypothetical protein
VVQEFTELMTLLADERGLAFPPARELQRFLPGIQSLVRGKMATTEMSAQFSVWGAKPFTLALEAFGNAQTMAAQGLPTDGRDFLADAQDYVGRVVLTALELWKLPAPTATTQETALLRLLEELEAKLRRQESGSTTSPSPAAWTERKRGASKAATDAKCRRWDGEKCPFGDMCRQESHELGVDLREAPGSQMCHDHAAGRCTRGDACRFKHD